VWRAPSPSAPSLLSPSYRRLPPGGTSRRSAAQARRRPRARRPSNRPSSGHSGG
jgi:hypothetical protein